MGNHFGDNKAGQYGDHADPAFWQAISQTGQKCREPGFCWPVNVIWRTATKAGNRADANQGATAPAFKFVGKYTKFENWVSEGFVNENFQWHQILVYQ